MNRFKIVTGKHIKNTVQKEKHAGVSIFKEDDGIYKIHLNIFPNTTYFMQKNKNNEYFTIFSRKGRDSLLTKPVGQGKILESLKTHLQLQFEVLNTTLYMSLFPQN